jgi:diguanylate cyclase (GGDEF)-like protein/PAS domain S-box-containing protein
MSERWRVYHWLDLFLLAGLAVLYALLAKLVLGFFSGNGVVSIVWPSSGLALGALLLGGKKYWPGIFIGALAGNLLAGTPFVVSSSIAAGNTLEAIAGVWLLLGFRYFNPALSHPRHYLWLGLAGSLCAMLSASIGVASLFLSGLLPQQALAHNLLNWWQGDLLGMILITPLMLVWRQRPRGWFQRQRVPETVACFGLAFLFGQAIFLEWFNDAFGRMLGFWMFLFFVWAAVRFGRHGAVLVMAMTIVQGLFGLVNHVGFFGANNDQSGLLNFWFYILVLSAVGISLALFVYERDRAEKSLSSSEEKLRGMFEMSPLGMARNSMDGRYIEANRALLDMVGYTLEQLNRLTYWDLTPKEYEAQEAEQLQLLNDSGQYGPFEKEYIHRDGHRLAVRLNGVLITDSDGEKYIWSTVEDISERKKSEESMQLAELVYRTSSEAIMVSDAQGEIIAINPAFTEMTGYRFDEVRGKNANILNSGHHDRGFYKDMWRQINATGCWKGEIWDRRKNGEIYAEWLSINTVFNEDGSVHRRVAQFTDITQKKQSEEMLWRQTNFDLITELPNRHMFRDCLSREIKEARSSNQSLALLLLDLDHFKQVNDTMGHGTGDRMLKDVAKRLLHCVRQTDTVARLGGDEFTIILTGPDICGHVENLAQRVLQHMAEPFHLDGEVMYASISIGITLYPDDAQDIDELFKNADQAMYAAKNLGRNRYQYFTSSMQEIAQTRMKLANDLRGALADKQFRVFYQPIVELSTGAIHKAEALIRWQHPTRGLVSPGEFIPIAEETGTIIDIGNWVFREAAKQSKLWRSALYPQFQISVNKSPVQFRHQNAVNESWPSQLHQLGLPGDSIVAEITEGLLLDAGDFIDNKLLEFRDAGIQLALDDFGTGYSSLSYIKKFNIDYIKIDQSFVRNMTAQSSDMVLCQAIIAMAHKLGIKVVAEGVETIEQRNLLAAAGCDYAQGFLFSKPVPVEEFESLPMKGHIGLMFQLSNTQFEPADEASFCPELIPAPE